MNARDSQTQYTVHPPRVQEGVVCLGQSISHLYHSLQCLGIVRRGFVKDNDIRYGLKVARRDPKSSKVTGL